MNPEAQRIAIAESCGWDRFCQYEVNGEMVKYGHPPKCVLRYETPLPDYLNDLNAMHEAEKVLTPLEVVTYWEWLFRVCNDCDFDGYDCGARSCATAGHATAAQRAEAFLRTIGKWVDGPKAV